MEIFILKFMLSFILGFITVTIYLNRADYKYYNQVYKSLNTELNTDIDKSYGSLFLCCEGVYIKWYYVTNYFILYIDGEQFTLRNDFRNIINPVRYYYYLKFSNWFRKNYPNLK